MQRRRELGRERSGSPSCVPLRKPVRFTFLRAHSETEDQVLYLKNLEWGALSESGTSWNVDGFPQRVKINEDYAPQMYF